MTRPLIRSAYVSLSPQEGHGLSRAEGYLANPFLRNLGCNAFASMVFLALIITGCTTEPSTPPPPAPTTYFDVTKNVPVTLSKPFAPKNTVLLFLRTDCPIGNRYVPKIKELAEQFSTDEQPNTFAFQVVYPDCNPNQIRQHQSDYDLTFQTFTDHEHVLVDAIGITRAPEVAVFDQSGTRVYRGRIDNQFVDFGTTRPAPTLHDLRDTLQSLVDGQTLMPRETQAVGCYIE